MNKLSLILMLTSFLIVTSQEHDNFKIKEARKCEDEQTFNENSDDCSTIQFFELIDASQKQKKPGKYAVRIPTTNLDLRNNELLIRRNNNIPKMIYAAKLMKVETSGTRSTASSLSLPLVRATEFHLSAKSIGNTKKVRQTRFKNNCRFVVVMLPVMVAENRQSKNKNEENKMETTAMTGEGDIDTSTINQLLSTTLAKMTSFSRDVFIFTWNSGANQQLTFFQKLAQSHFILIPEFQYEYEKDIDSKLQLIISRNQNDKLQSKGRNRNNIRLNKKNLNMAGITVPPILVLDGGKQPTTTGGTFHAFFETASKFYNFSYKFNTELFKKAGPGRMGKNGEWTGVIGSIVREECDLTFMVHQVSRYSHMHFSTPLFFDESIFVTALPKTSISWQAALIGPFTPTVWLFLIGSIILIYPTIYYSIYFRDYRYNDNQNHATSPVPGFSLHYIGPFYHLLANKFSGILVATRLGILEAHYGFFKHW